MIELTAIRPEMFPELRDGILREFSPQVPATVWERVFVRPVESESEPLGYALRNQGTYVGVLGMIFSRRHIAGQERRFCNLHSWYVQPEHRMRSLSLLKPLADLRDVTITDFTATPAVRAISERLGFQNLDSTSVVLPPLPRLWPAAAKLTEITSPESQGYGVLSPMEQVIQRDHSKLNCGHLLVQEDAGYCFIVYSRITHGRIPRLFASCLVHYVSDRRLFARHHAAIRAHLLRHGKSCCVVVDSRLLSGVRVPRSLQVQALPKIYRSPDVPPEQIDGLYSEHAFFKFSTLPTLKNMVKSATAFGS